MNDLSANSVMDEQRDNYANIFSYVSWLLPDVCRSDMHRHAACRC